MFKKIISLFLSLILIITQPIFAQGVAQLNLAQYLGKTPVLGTDNFRPTQLRYFSYDNLNNSFRILLDKGDAKDIKDNQLKEQAKELMDYFLIGLTLPNDAFWVNLRPDSPDNIIDPELEKTGLGRILLEADLQLKKDTAGLTSPQTPEGKAYWDKLYKKAGELFGTENITIPTITRPWIVPGEIIVRESDNSAYIYKANLKVMLEADYLKGYQPSAVSFQQYNFQDPRLKELNEYSSRIIRETIIPKLTQEVNSAKRYAKLRQVYYSLVLSRWFKQKYSSLRSIRASGHQSASMDYISLIDSGDLTNLTSKEPYDKLTYFKRYQESFAKGEYSLKEPVYTPYGQSIRAYMSGGFNGREITIAGVNAPETAGSSILGEYLKNRPDFVPLEISGNTQIKLTGNQEQPMALAASPVVSSYESENPTDSIMKAYIRAFSRNMINGNEHRIIDESFYYNPILAAYKLGRIIKDRLRNNQIKEASDVKKDDYEVLLNAEELDKWLHRLVINDIAGIRESIESVLADILSISPQGSSLWADIDAIDEQIKKIKTSSLDYISLIVFLDEAIDIIKKRLPTSGINRGSSWDNLEEKESELKKILYVAFTEAIISKMYYPQEFTKQILVETDLYVNNFKSAINRIKSITDYEHSKLSLALGNLPVQRKDHMIFNPGVVPTGKLLMLELKKSMAELVSELQAVNDAGADLTSSRLRFIHNRPCRILLGALADMQDNIDKVMKGYNILVDAGDNFEDSIDADALMKSSRSLHDAFFQVRGYLNSIFIKRFSNSNGIKLEVLKDSYELYGGDGLFLSAKEIFHSLPKRYQYLYYALYNSSGALKKYEDRCKILRNVWSVYKSGSIASASPLVLEDEVAVIQVVREKLNEYHSSGIKDFSNVYLSDLISAVDETAKQAKAGKQREKWLGIAADLSGIQDKVRNNIETDKEKLADFYANIGQNSNSEDLKSRYAGYAQTIKATNDPDEIIAAAEWAYKLVHGAASPMDIKGLIKDLELFRGIDWYYMEKSFPNVFSDGFVELKKRVEALKNSQHISSKSYEEYLSSSIYSSILNIFLELRIIANERPYKKINEEQFIRYRDTKEVQSFLSSVRSFVDAYKRNMVVVSPVDGTSSAIGAQEIVPVLKRGGIDFTDRAMKIGLEPMGSFAASALVLPEIANAAAIDLDAEFKQIQLMASSGIRPSDTRILEFEVACYYRGEFNARLGEITACLQQAHFLDERLGRESSEALRLATLLPEVM